MWAFLSRRLRRWVLIAVAAPLGARLLHSLADTVEERRGRSSLTKGLRGAAGMVPGGKSWNRSRKRL
jgi:hypothetical protein